MSQRIKSVLVGILAAVAILIPTYIAIANYAILGSWQNTLVSEDTALVIRDKKDSTVFEGKAGEENTLNLAKALAQMLKDGKCVGIFPQGHREKGITPHEAHLKQGAAMLAVKAQATVLPCCVKTKKMKFSFFRRVDVYFGKPIKFEELNYDPEASGEYMRITNQIFSKVCELYDNAVAEEQKSGK
jgi:1-acyl-sn-glycerol-3-phosphate acyltransferase